MYALLFGIKASSLNFVYVVFKNDSDDPFLYTLDSTSLPDFKS